MCTSLTSGDGAWLGNPRATVTARDLGQVPRTVGNAELASPGLIQLPDFNLLAPLCRVNQLDWQCHYALKRQPLQSPVTSTSVFFLRIIWITIIFLSQILVRFW